MATTPRAALAAYRSKRDFDKTPEPHDPRPSAAAAEVPDGALSFVVQKHHASSLHYDFRLEFDGTLKSWAVPKGPCLDPAVKRMAVEVEDHPISYGGFEGTIPPKQYGAGTVIVWDRGHWSPEGGVAATRKAFAAGKLKFELHGEKLHGRWTLVRMRGKGEKQPPWLLIKERDDAARPLDDYDVLEALPDSVLGGSSKQPRPSEPKTSRARPRAKARSTLPDTLSPQLATLAAEPPGTPADWLWELKFDGYRLLTRIENGTVRCITRNGHDWTAKLPEIETALERLKLRSAWLDGEIVVQGERGAPDFQALQNAFDRRSTASIVYWVFDLLFLDGEDLRDMPVEERRQRLSTLLGDDDAPRLRFSETFDAPPRDLLESVSTLGFEGLIGKRRGSTYGARRTAEWIKLKTQQRQEFVIGGFTAPKGTREGFGALLLGVHDDDAEDGLAYCGNVGTGFDASRLADIKAKLDRLASERSPFASGRAGVPTAVKATWVKPRLVAEIAFGGWTRDGRVRHGVFQGLRSDKPAGDIVRERPLEAREVSEPARAVSTANSMPKAKTTSRLSHAERVVDAESGVTKGELAAYYVQCAGLILPHLDGRPVSLVRAPDGVGGELFFQKHAKGNDMQGVKLLDAALDPGHEPLLAIDSVEGLASAAQMNVIEFHTWNATASAIDRPDRMTLDLDPGEGVGWAAVQEAAMLVRTLLQEVGLVGFLKTSGGKGLHVVIPIRRHYGWDAVKTFSQSLVEHLATTIPARFVAKSGPKNRVGKVFVDYLRNGFGATTASAWSVRARPGLGVSVPVAWDELPSLTGGAHWNLKSVADRLDTGNSPWSGWERDRRGLAGPMKKFGFKAPRAAAGDAERSVSRRPRRS